MASGKYSRIDGKKSLSSYCSTVTIVVFVALCLVGVWMMTSSSAVPSQTVDLSSQENKNGAREEVSESNPSKVSNDNNETNSKEFEDNHGDLPEDATKGEGTVNVAQEEKNNAEVNSNTSEKNMEGNKEEKPENDPLKESVAEETKSEDGPKAEAENGEEKSGDGNSNMEDKDSEVGKTRMDIVNDNSGGDAKEGSTSGKSDSVEGEKNTVDGTKDADEVAGKIEDKVVQNEKKEIDQTSGNENVDAQSKDVAPGEVFPSGAQTELLNETTTQIGAWSTQASESKNEKEAQSSPEAKDQSGFNWKICNATAGYDFIPCLDNLRAIKHLKTTKHYEHRERHCPDDPPTCLVPLPEGYQRPVEWPTSREKIWYHNVPHTKLAEYKGHQNWVKVTGEFLTFPGGGTQFKHGALHYIDFIQQSIPDIAWGKRSRVVQFALERGIPAISAVMGTRRLPFPGRVFDVVHCARCRVPWHIEGGKLLLELNRVLRPGGYFVWSATPVYQKLPEDTEIWKAMKQLTKSMCWDLVQISRDKLNKVGIAMFQKPTSNECYEKRSQNEPPLCQEFDDPNAAWNVPLQACMHKLPVNASERGSQWPELWPVRLDKPPYWLISEVGVYGKPAPEDFTADYEHWKNVVTNSYLKGMGINWSTVRNVMDMKTIYGGFAAALKDLKVWVMNVYKSPGPDFIIILWPHRCNLVALIAEVDRILRPDGKLIVRDKVDTMNELESLLKSMHWEIRFTYSRDKEGILCAQKTVWRPAEVETIMYAIS
ncbi:unnamed protein product [Thlaspi arvense]|uniref:Methyltransferase n=1 Tax=Thlaspi arvense TaxID=13288 RepID=A0AAU9TB04_THLAR|nr:unnamed protein product [Thlaspi arvense]